MKYIYFVSYATENGFGCCDFCSDYQMIYIDHVNYMINKIKQKTGSNITVINFILLRTEE